MNGHLGKQHSSVTLEPRCRSALHLAIPEQAPSPVPAFELSGALTFRSFHSRPTTWGYVPGENIFSLLGRLLLHHNDLGGGPLVSHSRVRWNIRYPGMSIA